VVGAGWLGGLGGCFRKKLAESWFIAFGVGVIQPKKNPALSALFLTPAPWPFEVTFW
jgi:hypothetical protein